jgi:2-hydroxy-3-oxopropionate reductase
MSETSTKVGFIGLGRMGKPMAVNVLTAGFALTVYDLRQETVRELTELGAQGASSPREVAEAADLIAIVVVDDAQVEAVLCGADGVLAGARAGTIAAFTAQFFPAR